MFMLSCAALFAGTVAASFLSGCGGKGAKVAMKPARVVLQQAAATKKDEGKSTTPKTQPTKTAKKEVAKKEVKQAPVKKEPLSTAPFKVAPTKKEPIKTAPVKLAAAKKEPAKALVKAQPAAPAEQAKQAPAAKPLAANLLAKIVDKKANAPIKPGDWSQWGGTSYRNNTPFGKNIPIEWAVGNFDRKTGKWDRSSAKNIRWVVSIGSQTYGNPVVAKGQVYVGTNNGSGYLKRYSSNVDLGCMLAFSEKDGKFLWQDSSEKLSTGRVHDWPLQGICCAPLVQGERLWYVTSRGEVVCVDTRGYYDDEDDGPIKNQPVRLIDIRRAEVATEDKVGPAVKYLQGGRVSQYVRDELARVGVKIGDAAKATAGKAKNTWNIATTIDGKPRKLTAMLRGPKLSLFRISTPDDKQEADRIWVYNMMENLKVSQHNMCSCSVTAMGDILFVNTSNGLDESHINLPSPDAPTFIAMDKNTGKVLWTDKSPGANILHGQWSSPTVAVLGGVPQAIFAGGDGWVYSFKADKGKNGKPQLLWKFDANPKKSKWILGGRGTRNNIIATPVVYDGLVYVAVGQDPEHGEGEGHVWCINPHKRGDVSPELAVKRSAPKTSIPHRRLQAVIEKNGEVAVANPNSAVIWHYSAYDQNKDKQIDFEEQMHRSCGTVAIKNDLLYIADFSGLFHCLNAKTGKVHWTYDMLAAAWGSPLIVENRVYIGDEDGDVAVFELKKQKHDPIAEINMQTSVYSTPVVANNTLYISTKNKLFAIAPDKKKKK